MAFTRWLLAWAFYWLGDAVSRVMDFWPWERGHPYFLYSRLMNMAARVQGDGSGPWMRLEADRD